MAPLVALQAQQLCVSCSEQIRHQTMSPNHVGLPWVSEFAKICELPPTAPVPANGLLSTPVVGNIASAGNKTIGIHRSPEDFVKTALEIGHPGFSENLLPEPMQEAAHFISEHSEQFVATHRSEVLRRIVQKAKDLTSEEAALKSSMSLRRREVLKNKRVLLFKELLVDGGSPDVNLVEDICTGFEFDRETASFPPV